MTTTTEDHKNSRSESGSSTATVNHLPETIKERLLRRLLGRAKRNMEFVLVAKDSEHMSKATEIAGREAKKARNRLKKRPPPGRIR